MDYHNDYENHFNTRKQRRSTAQLVLVALAGGLIGALAMALVAPYLIYGTIIPWPDHLSSQMRVNYQLPDAHPTAAPVSDTGDSTNSITQVAEGQGPSVVGVINKGYVRDWYGNTSMQDLASGSGFIIDPTGLIVTNQHVINNAEEIEVILPSGTHVVAKIVGVDVWSDLAVLGIDLNDLPEDERTLPFVTFGDSSKLRVGQTVIAIGNPLGMEFARTVTSGIVSAVDRVVTVGNRQYSLIQTDAAINSGNSGGPLLDTSGNVIGINQIKISDAGIEGLGFAIPSDQAKPIIEQLISKGKIERPLLGIKGQLISLNPDKSNYKYGILISEVASDSPADVAGFKVGDAIVAIGDDEVTSFTELQRILYSHSIGDTITVSIYRDATEELLHYEVKLSKAADS